jgi:serine/threonine protein kinase
MMKKNFIPERQADLIETLSQIGRYELGRQIGFGQHSIVKKCYDPECSRTFAMKIMSPEDGYESIQAELLALNLLQTHPPHPNILGLHDCLHGNYGIYLLTEYSQTDLVPLPCVTCLSDWFHSSTSWNTITTPLMSMYVD